MSGWSFVVVSMKNGGEGGILTPSILVPPTTLAKTSLLAAKYADSVASGW